MTALIETVRVRRGAAPLWYLHLRRLASSCKALGIPLPPELLTPAGGPDRVHRLQVERRGLEVTERPLPGRLDGVRLVLSRETHRPYPHKTTDRGQFDRALEEARARGADDALLLTVGGYVAEAAVWALFWWEGDRVCAPPLALGVLPSVARARVAELTGGVGERRVRLEEIRGSPLFAGNAVRGLVRVTSLDDVQAAEHTGFSDLAERFWS
ncbi:MAG: aminotransferase class IV [Gemmatimonadales bacterium]|nr:aminotransferase class IV [Gemmatimonadales bacterium]